MTGNTYQYRYPFSFIVDRIDIWGGPEFFDSVSHDDNVLFLFIELNSNGGIVSRSCTYTGTQCRSKRDPRGIICG
jgi:hypothetical protein